MCVQEKLSCVTYTARNIEISSSSNFTAANTSSNNILAIQRPLTIWTSFKYVKVFFNSNKISRPKGSVMLFGNNVACTSCFFVKEEFAHSSYPLLSLILVMYVQIFLCNVVSNLFLSLQCIEIMYLISYDVLKKQCFLKML